MAFTEVLNLEKILVSYLAGSMEVFFFLAIIAITWIAAKYRMPNAILAVLLGLFVVLMTNYFSMMYMLVIILAALFMYFALAKSIKS